MNRDVEAAHQLTRLKKKQRSNKCNRNNSKAKNSLFIKGLALVATPLIHIAASPDHAASQTVPSSERTPNSATPNSAVQQGDDGLNAFQVLMKELPSESVEKVGQSSSQAKVPPIPTLQEKPAQAVDQSDRSPAEALPKSESSASIPTSFETITGASADSAENNASSASIAAELQEAQKVTAPASAVTNSSMRSEVERAIGQTQAVSAEAQTTAARESSSAKDKPSAPNNITNGKTDGPAQTLSGAKQHSESLFGGLSDNDAANFWKSASAGLGLLLAVALLGLQMMRSKKGGLARQKTSAKALELLATLPIGPKRQILLIKVRDSEIAVASTESGVSLLTQSSRSGLGTTHEISGEISHLALPKPAPATLTSNQGLKNAAQRVLSQVSTARKHELKPIGSETESKSEILRKAIETIETRRAKPAQAAAHAGAQSEGSLAHVEAAAPKFKKHASNSYAQVGNQPPAAGSAATDSANRPPTLGSTLAQKNSVSNRTPNDEQRNSTQPVSSRAYGSNARASQSESSQVESSQTDNVAQLIREKLKQMKALNS